jgi:hypothetical protein
MNHKAEVGVGEFEAYSKVRAPTSAGPYGCVYTGVGPNTGAKTRSWGVAAVSGVRSQILNPQF